MTDTDSLYYLIEHERDPTDVMHDKNERPEGSIFDLGECSRYKDCRNKGKLGFMKEESGDDNIEQMICLCAKMYCLLVRGKNGEDKYEIKAKGVPKNQAKKQFTFASYRDALYLNKRETIEFRAMRSFDHKVKHLEIHRLGLTADNDKVFLTSPHSSRPLNHWRNTEPETQHPEWALTPFGQGVDDQNMDEILAAARKMAEAMQAEQELLAAAAVPVSDEEDEDMEKSEGDEDESTALNSEELSSMADDEWEM